MSDLFPNNKNNFDSTNSFNITIVHSNFNSEIVNKLLEVTEKRLLEMSKPKLTKSNFLHSLIN